MKMTADHKNPAFRMLFLIATPRSVEKGIDLFKKGDIPVQYVFCAQGTATSEVMATLGLCGEEKNILISMMPKTFADLMLVKLQKKLHLGMPGSGIAFTIAMSGGSKRVAKMIEALDTERSQTHLGRYGAEMIENEYG